MLPSFQTTAYRTTSQLAWATFVPLVTIAPLSRLPCSLVQQVSTVQIWEWPYTMVQIISVAQVITALAVLRFQHLEIRSQVLQVTRVRIQTIQNSSELFVALATTVVSNRLQRFHVVLDLSSIMKVHPCKQNVCRAQLVFTVQMEVSVIHQPTFVMLDIFALLDPLHRTQLLASWTTTVKLERLIWRDVKLEHSQEILVKIAVRLALPAITAMANSLKYHVTLDTIVIPIL